MRYSLYVNDKKGRRSIVQHIKAIHFGIVPAVGISNGIPSNKTVYIKGKDTETSEAYSDNELLYCS